MGGVEKRRPPSPLPDNHANPLTDFKRALASRRSLVPLTVINRSDISSLLNPNSEVEMSATNFHAAGARRLRSFDARTVWYVRTVRDVGR